MRVVFMGSAEIACPSVEAMLAAPGIDLVGIVTQPDRPSGRLLKARPCPACAYARQRGIEPFAPVSINSPESAAWLGTLAPDVIVVIAYGQLLRPPVLALPPLGCINVHASLLPRYRGAAPIQWAIANGETVTGVTTMFMDAGMDTGDMIGRRSVPIAPDDTAAELHDKLATVGAELLLETLARVADGTAPRVAQDAALATHARKLTKEDGAIDWRQSAAAIRNHVRGFNPWPCCHCRMPEHVLRGHGQADAHVLRVHQVEVREGGGMPGSVIALAHDGPVIACGTDALALVEVQPEGRRRMSGAAYLCGHTLQAGDRLSMA